MGVRFDGRSRPATSEETKHFNQLRPIKLDRIIKEGKNLGALVGKGMTDFDGDGSLDKFVCIDKPGKSIGRSFSCFVDGSGKKPWFVDISEFLPERKRAIRELRIGDINGDGRPDIAIRLHGGSILVFENKK